MQTTIRGFESLTHTWELLREYPAESSDGHATRVLVMRMPARFYRVEADAGAGRTVFAFETGSGTACEQLAHAMALAIAQGMLALA